MKVVRNQTSTATDMLTPDHLYRMYSNMNVLLERIASFGIPVHGLMSCNPSYTLKILWCGIKIHCVYII